MNGVHEYTPYEEVHHVTCEKSKGISATIFMRQ